MSEALRAKRIVVSPEIVLQDAVLIHENGRVLEVGPASEVLPRLDEGTREALSDMGSCTVVPAPVNGHCHLELSHIKGRTMLGHGFTAWVQSLLALGMKTLNQCDEKSLEAAVAQLVSSGTAHVADVTSRRPLQVARAADAAGLGVTLLAEAFGFAPLSEEAPLLPRPFAAAPAGVLERMAVSGHAPYSTSPERMQAAKRWCQDKGRAFALHLAEHEGEVAMLERGEGDFAELFRTLLLPKDWRAPGMRPVAFADSLGLLDGATLAVHCVQVDKAEARLLAERGVTVCLCPRSNAALGVGTAPLHLLRGAGVRLCLGTDSLASNDDLDIWQELRHAVRIMETGPEPERPGLGEVVALLSGNAARVLGLHDMGTLEPGKRAVWTLLPADLEYLQ